MAAVARPPSRPDDNAPPAGMRPGRTRVSRTEVDYRTLHRGTLAKERVPDQVADISSDVQECRLDTVPRAITGVRESVDERFALVREAIADRSDIDQMKEAISEDLRSTVQEGLVVAVQRKIVNAIREEATRTVQEQVGEVVRREVKSVVQHEVKSIVDEKVAAIIQGGSHQYSQTAGHHYCSAAGHYHYSAAGHGNPGKAAVQHPAIEPEPIVCRRRPKSTRQPAQ